MTGIPTLSQMRSWDTAHLDLAADYWASEAQNWESVFTTAFQAMARPGGQPWDGDAADRAQLRAHLDRLRVIGVADLLRTVADTARAGARDLRAAQRKALDVVDDATATGFEVDEQLFVSYPGYVNAVRAAVTHEQAIALATRLHAAATALAALDSEVAAEVAEAIGAIDVADFIDTPPGPAAVPEPGFARRPVPTREELERREWKQDKAIEAAETVAGTTSDEVRKAALGAIKEAPAGASPTLVKWLEDARIRGTALSGVTRINAVVGVAAAVPAVIADVDRGTPVTKAVATKSAGLLAGALAAAGAGTLVCPGAGTAVGLMVGLVAAAVVSPWAEDGAGWAYDQFIPG